MAYLIQSDFKKLIQTDNLNQIIGGDNSILLSIQRAAQSEAVSYLVQKYITAEEFTDTNAYDSTISYDAKDRIYLDAQIYNAALNYILDQLTQLSGNIYICVSATTGTFDLTKWTLLGVQGTIFFVTLPATEFNYYNFYNVGSIVFWQDSVYTCLIATRTNDHSASLQTGNRDFLINTFPNDPINGIQNWGVGVPYFVSTAPNDLTSWTQGDNRNPQLVNYCIDIALYHIHSRIAPRNIPELRVVRHQEAIQWLKDAGQGKITADLPLIQPKSGGRIRFGGEIKRINNY